MILTVTGCYGTGSSAVTDLIRECKDVHCKDDYEVRFIHDPDGISDLEYHLIENPNRHNTSHAIKRFIRMMDMLDHVYFIKRYRKHLGDDFLQLAEEYVNDITEYQYHAIWHNDVYEKGKVFYVLDSIYRKMRSMLHKRLKFPLGRTTLLSQNELAYLGITDEEQFLYATKKFIRGVVNSVNRDGKRDVFLDQLVPPSNIERYERYFDGIKIIIVERDPRDLFILGRECWGGRVMPENVDDFCLWYLWTRSIYEREHYPESTLWIMFEDMIYHYEETVDKILEHYGISKGRHINRKKYFKPEISIGNTKLWEKFDGYSKELKVIEKKLSRCCYCFPKDFDMNKSDREKHRIF